MWTVFIGILLGLFQVYLLKKTISFVTSDKDRLVMGVLVSFGKMALLLVVLFLIARFVSLPAMIWCACGAAGAMITMAIVHGVQSIKQYKTIKPQGGEQG